MIGGETIVVAGIEIPSTDPVFLTVIFAIQSISRAALRA
jgi:hypothetical protein